MKVNSTHGPLQGEELGHTLMHEHLFVNMLREYREGGLLNDMDLMVNEVAAFKLAGGSTIVDVTTAEMSWGAAPDPDSVLGAQPSEWEPDDRIGSRTRANVEAVNDLAHRTGIQVVMGTGHYRDPYIDAGWVDRRTPETIARRMIRDIESGFEGTPIRAGIIGEVGCDKWYVSAAEERCLRAAGLAQLETGVAITTHAARWPVGVQQLEILMSVGVDPKRVVIGHCDTVPIPEYHEYLARQGAYVQFDTIRGQSEYDTNFRVEMIRKLLDAGFESRILLSHDVCRRSLMHVGDGEGYDFIPLGFAKRLREAGLDEDDLSRMMVMNPRQVLAGEDL